jgi:nitrite reductase/ring-hydroxylating ferredoxin subunit
VPFFSQIFEIPDRVEIDFHPVPETTKHDGCGEKRSGDVDMGLVRAAKTGEILPGTIREFQLEGKAIAIANVGGKFHAISNTCLHRGGPLGQGVMDGSTVTCPWHGWQFDVTTGKVGQNPTVGVDCYSVEVRGEEIFVNA